MAQIDPGGADPCRAERLGEQADDFGVSLDAGVPVSSAPSCKGSRVAVSDDGTAWATLPQ